MEHIYGVLTGNWDKWMAELISFNITAKYAGNSIEHVDCYKWNVHTLNLVNWTPRLNKIVGTTSSIVLKKKKLYLKNSYLNVFKSIQIKIQLIQQIVKPVDEIWPQVAISNLYTLSYVYIALPLPPIWHGIN